MNLFDEIASDPSDAVTANFPLFTSTSPATSSVLDSVAAPVAFSVPATTVLPVSPATVNLFDEIASDPSDAVTANFPLSRPRRLPHPAQVLDSVATFPSFSVPATTVLPVSPATVNLFDEIASDPSDAVTANFPLFTSTSPATSSVLDSVAAPVASSVPATTVLPVSPATVNLFDEIASDPSDAVTANFPLFTSTSPATSSVLDSVAAPVAFSVPATTVLPVSPATVNLFDEIASDPSDAVTAANFPLFTSTSPATSSVLDSVAAPVAFSVPATTVLPVSPATVNLFDEIASDPSDAVTTNALLPTSTSKLTFSSPAIATFPTPDALLSVMMSVSPLTPICAPVTLTDSTSTYEAVLEISTYPFVLVMDRPPPVDPECVSATDCFDISKSSSNVTAPETERVLVRFEAPATSMVPDMDAETMLRLVTVIEPASRDPATTVFPVEASTVNFPLFTSTSPATSSVLDSVAAPVAFSVPATTVLPVSPATVNLFDEIASDPSDAVTANFPLFTSTSPATSSVLDSVAAPVAFSVPATTVLPVSPATVNLFDEIASDPSDAVTANFPLFTSTSPATSSVLDSVAAPVAFSVPATTVLPVSPATVNLFDEIASDPSDAVTANFPLFTSTSPATSSVLDSVAAPVAFSVPATTVLPVSPATVNLFDEIASDPSDAVTANFPLFTSTSPATSSVLDSVAAPVAFSVPATTVLPVSPATVNLFDEIASDPSDAVTANFPLFTSTSPATSSVLDSVAAPVAFSVPATTVLPVSPATVNLFDEIASDPSDAVTANFPCAHISSSRRRLHSHPACSTASQLPSSFSADIPATTVLPVSPATVNLFDEIASDPSDASPQTSHCSRPRRLPHPACSTASQLPSRSASPPPPCCPCRQPP